MHDRGDGNTVMEPEQMCHSQLQAIAGLILCEDPNYRIGLFVVDLTLIMKRVMSHLNCNKLFSVFFKPE